MLFSADLELDSCYVYINSHICCISSQRILDTLVKFCAVATEFFYVDGQTDMLKLMFYFLQLFGEQQLCQSGN